MESVTIVDGNETICEETGIANKNENGERHGRSPFYSRGVNGRSKGNGESKSKKALPE